MPPKKKAEGTVTTKAMQYEPVGFNSFGSLEELHTVADYYGVEKADNPQEQIANFANDGVSYAQYCKDFNVPLPEDYVEEEEALAEVEDEKEDTVKEEVAPAGPVTASRTPQFAVQSEYLIKMTRDNPYFEVANLVNRKKVYKFTNEHPYAVMDAKTAQFVLSNEEGFRQAFPDELAEFYAE